MSSSNVINAEFDRDAAIAVFHEHQARIDLLVAHVVLDDIEPDMDAYKLRTKKLLQLSESLKEPLNTIFYNSNDEYTKPNVLNVIVSLSLYCSPPESNTVRRLLDNNAAFKHRFNVLKNSIDKLANTCDAFKCKTSGFRNRTDNAYKNLSNAFTDLARNGHVRRDVLAVQNFVQILKTHIYQPNYEDKFDPLAEEFPFGGYDDPNVIILDDRRMGEP